MKIIHDILKAEPFVSQPPALVDIGASGSISSRWKAIAPYSVCIAYDADEREFSVTERKNSGYRKLFIVNRAVTAVKQDTIDFYLTSSPFCSSTLAPDYEKLKPWLFSNLFEVKKKTRIAAVTLEESLLQTGLTYIDWFKADTQGTDLRLFNSLPSVIKKQVLAAEFEPGIMDAYAGEDKLPLVMQILAESGFWLSSMEIKGTQRIHISGLPISEFAVKRSLRISPGWAELIYLQNSANCTDKRQLLLLYIFALLEKQYGFAMETAERGIALFTDPVFQECKKAAVVKLKREQLKIPFVMLKKQLTKIFPDLHA
jgi:hypothetical protein